MTKETTPEKQFVVIGGGPAGLTAAYELTRFNFRPIVLEKRELKPFHTFELGGTIYPLTQDRLESAMINPKASGCRRS